MTTRPALDEFGSPNASSIQADVRFTSPTPSAPLPADDSGRYGHSPFSARAQLFSAMDSQISSPAPKQAQVVTVGVGGISSGQPLGSQPLHGGASQFAMQRGDGGGASGGLPSVPSSPLGVLAARRARAGMPSPLPPNGVGYQTATWDSTGEPLQGICTPGGNGLSELYSSSPMQQDRYSSSPNKPGGAMPRPSAHTRLRSAGPPPPHVAPTDSPSRPTDSSGRLMRADSSVSGPPSSYSSPHAAAGGRDVMSPAQPSTPFWERGCRPTDELTTTDLAPLQHPEEAARQAIAKIQQANQADRKTMDWQVRAFVGLLDYCAYHD